MAGHEVYVFLRVSVHAASLGNDVPNVLVILFKACLLVGNVRVTVKHVRPAFAVCRAFDAPGILEFRPVVRENHGEMLLKETRAKNPVKGINGFRHTLLSTFRQEDDQHETAAPEQQRQEALAAGATAFDGVHFNHVKVGVVLHKELKVLVGALVAIDLIDAFDFWLDAFFPFFVADPSWKVDVAGLKNAAVKVIVQGSPAHGDFVRMDGKHVAERLPVKHKGRNEVV